MGFTLGGGGDGDGGGMGMGGRDSDGATGRERQGWRNGEG